MKESTRRRLEKRLGRPLYRSRAWEHEQEQQKKWKCPTEIVPLLKHLDKMMQQRLYLSHKPESELDRFIQTAMRFYPVQVSYIRPEWTEELERLLDRPLRHQLKQDIDGEK